VAYFSAVFNKHRHHGGSLACMPAFFPLHQLNRNAAAYHRRRSLQARQGKSRPKPKAATPSFGFRPRSTRKLEFWRGRATNPAPDAFIFPSSRGTAINTNNFLFRVLKEGGRNAGIEGVTHQMLRRTCSTYIAQITSVKNVQAHRECVGL